MKFEGVCIIQESGFGFKFRIPYDSCTHECNSYHAWSPSGESMATLSTCSYSQAFLQTQCGKITETTLTDLPSLC